LVEGTFGQTKRSAKKRMESEDKTETYQPAVAQALLEAHERDTREEIRRTKEALEQCMRELSQALVIVRATLESTTDAILMTDADGKVTDFNDKYLAMWKIPRESLQGGTPGDVRELASRNFADPQRFFSRIAEIDSTAEASFDLLESKDGRLLQRYSKVLSVENRNMGRLWTFRDVTQRRLSEINSSQLASIVASSEDAIISKDLRSIVTSWNSGAERIFGYTADEMIGTSIMRLIPADRQPEEVEILSRIRRGERVDHFETIRIAKGGRKLNVSITVSPIKDSARNVVGASKIARDITERKKVEAALKEANESERQARSEAERANRLKDEFLAMLSHELRTPLNAVLGWAKLLQIGKPDVEELKQGLQTIERNAHVQAQIIEDLLEMSRITSGKVRLNVGRIDLPSILHRSIETIGSTAEAKGIQVKLVTDSRAGLISGDPDRLQQVFWNLLDNAIKFTPPSGEVLVSLKRVDSHIEVSVIDTGDGIAPEFLPHVFDRFKQADPSTTRRHGGLGLGLAIVKQLVKLHGGDVSVSSEGVGKGTTFTVCLPLAAVDSESDEKTHPVLAQASLANVHILVVDDEPDARELVKRLLEMTGAEVSMAGSASEAIENILISRPDVLVCDIGMPEEDGYSLIRQVRDLEEGQQNSLPAVALTAYARSEDRTKSIRAGFQHHLAKPVEPAELLAVVSSLARAGRKVTNSPVSNQPHYQTGAPSSQPKG
jgi:PAS domain S-box-containing protein